MDGMEYAISDRAVNRPRQRRIFYAYVGERVAATPRPDPIQVALPGIAMKEAS